MSANCIQCVKNPRTGPDLLCDECEHKTEIKKPDAKDPVAQPHADAANRTASPANRAREQLDAALSFLSHLVCVALLDVGRVVAELRMMPNAPAQRPPI